MINPGLSFILQAKTQHHFLLRRPSSTVKKPNTKRSLTTKIRPSTVLPIDRKEKMAPSIESKAGCSSAPPTTSSGVRNTRAKQTKFKKIVTPEKTKVARIGNKLMTPQKMGRFAGGVKDKKEMGRLKLREIKQTNSEPLMGGKAEGWQDGSCQVTSSCDSLSNFDRRIGEAGPSVHRVQSFAKNFKLKKHSLRRLANNGTDGGGKMDSKVKKRKKLIKSK